MPLRRRPDRLISFYGMGHNSRLGRILSVELQTCGASDLVTCLIRWLPRVFDVHGSAPAGPAARSSRGSNGLFDSES